jgi:ABC-type Fe3+/spermidine/putrescine transport system ATPase subunit
LRVPVKVDAPTPADVELRGVTKEFEGKKAVASVSLALSRGEFFSLLGPSGCGKSTILRMIAGFEHPTDGRILLGGADVDAVPPHRRDVNLVFQNYALFPHLDVFENVAFGLRRARASDIPRCVEEVLEIVHLSGYGRRSTTSLSGGEQQRVALARAIGTKPRVLLLDEPLSALDRKLRKGMQEELKRIHRDVGITFLYVTHDQDEALSMSDRVGVMAGGRLEQVGTPAEVFESPATRFVAEFIGSANFFEGSVRGGRFETEDGLLFPAPPGARDGRATLVVRPERVVIGCDPLIRAVISDVLYLGARASIILDAGGRRLTAVVDAAALRGGANGGVLEPGRTCSIAWRPEDARVIPQ